MADCSVYQSRHLSLEALKYLIARLLLAGRWIIVLLLLGAPNLQAAGSQPPDVLILNSYAPGYPWSDDEQAGVLSILSKKHREIEPVIEYLDFNRFTDPGREAWLIQDVADKCRTRPPRLIITLDNAAFNFALKYRSRLGPEVPLVFGGLNRFTNDMIAGQKKITGVSEEFDFSGTFTLIRYLRPGTRHILVIGSQTMSSIESRKAFESFIPRYINHYTFEYFDRWTNAELINRVASLPDDWVGLILDVSRDVTGRYNYNNAEFSQMLSSRARVPVFLTARPPGKYDSSAYAWNGIGGGMAVAELHGAKVGELANRILEGEEADTIPIVRHPPQRLEVDFRQMKRFNLSLDLLPQGTQAINTPVTFYQINRSRIILTAVIMVVLCGIIIALSLNILWRMRAERALRQAEEHLRSSQKLEAIGLLAGGVAHDFNNILQVIQGHTSFLEETLTESPHACEDITAIKTAAERASQLTRQLLTFSRKQPLKTEAVDPDAMVTDMAKMLRRLLGDHINLQVTPLAEPGTLMGDKGQLEQMLMNLCVNARDAMPGGGQIRIKLERISLRNTKAAGYSELKDGSYVVLTVSDSGCGIPHENLDHLFEPFYTTKDLGKGTGLGLSVVYGIVSKHNGAIRVQSEVGKGSVFTILLPIHDSQMEKSTATAFEDFMPGKGTILLAEDDPDVCRITAHILEHNGFKVIQAADGEEAETLFSQNHEEIRLAVLDVLMPKRNGRQVFDFLRAHYPEIRVLFCSGYSAEMLPPEIAPESGVAMINKPYSDRELLTQVHRLLET
jgi:signal transduction histidine kinase